MILTRLPLLVLITYSGYGTSYPAITNLLPGGKVSGASPAYNVEEMTYALRTADAKFLATSPTSIEIAVKAAANAGIPKERIFLLEGQIEGFQTIKDLAKLGKAYGAEAQEKSFEVPPGKKSGDICAFLSFSSGTTGLPKAVSEGIPSRAAFPS